MKFTLGWLKEHLDTNASVEKISETLTSLGLEVEQVIDQSAALAPFTVAYIEKAEPHPNADKLRVCTVQTSEGVKQIVCGAPNARAGIKVALATEGVTIPTNGMVIKKTKIRSVESNGMLCSAAELGLDTDSEGIIELPADAPVGESIVKTLGLADPVFDIAITPNRPDCLGVHGIARDLAAVGLGKLLPLPPGEGRGEGPSPITVTIEDQTACPMFVGCTIKGVKNAASPDWMQKRLRAIGLRPISALVDITNYVTFDLGRPLHAYDAKKLKGNIHVAFAKNGEKLQALDNKEYTLDDNMVTIRDDSGAINLGAIIGGTSTAVDENTTDIFLECALFDPARIAATGRKLGINSDARYRLERGVDPNFVEPGAAIAVALILKLCGGTASQLTIAGKNPHVPKTVPFRPTRVAALSGMSVPEPECYAILQSLGFKRTGDKIEAPSYRPDIDGEADLVEEIIRIKGYANIPSTPLPSSLPTSSSRGLTAGSGEASRDPAVKPRDDGNGDVNHRAHLTRRVWAARGLMEAVTWSFLAEKDAKLFGQVNPALSLLNPISADLDTMRPGILPNLLSAAKRNAGRGFTDLALFEVGACFTDVTPQGQEPVACSLRTALSTPRNPFSPVRPADAFDAKGDAFAALETLGMNTASLRIDRDVPAWYHPARSGRITLGGKVVLGYFGELHPSVLQKMDIDFPAVGCEIFLARIPQPKAKSKTRPPLIASNFQSAQRDFAFLADEKLQSADILQAVRAVDKALISDTSVFDIYAGKGIEPGKKSIAITVTLQAPDRTLTEEEINGISQKIIAAAQALGMSLRQ